MTPSSLIRSIVGVALVGLACGGCSANCPDWPTPTLEIASFCGGEGTCKLSSGAALVDAPFACFRLDGGSSVTVPAAGLPASPFLVVLFLEGGTEEQPSAAQVDVDVNGSPVTCSIQSGLRASYLACDLSSGVGALRFSSGPGATDCLEPELYDTLPPTQPCPG